MTSLFLLAAVLPALIKAEFLLDPNCVFNVKEATDLGCKPSNVQCVGPRNFTACVNVGGLTVMPSKVYSCPHDYVCKDDEQNVVCVVKPDYVGPPKPQKLALPPQLVTLITLLKNIAPSVPEIPPEVSWPAEERTDPPYIVDVPNEVQTTTGKDVTISCGAAGTPAPTITWHKDGKVLNDVGGRYIVNKDQTLTILNVEVTDHGTYECKAQNGEGEPLVVVYNYIHLTVVQIKENPAVFGQEGESVIVPCDNYIKPGSNVMWLKDGIGIKNDEKHKINKDYSLEIKEPSKSDSGKYYCSVVEKNGYVRTAKTVVLIRSPDAFGPPEIKWRPNIKVVGCLRGVINLQCPITGNPTPRILWLRGGFPIDISNPKYNMNHDQTLTVNRLEQSDAGVYYCTGDNNIGKPLTAEITLATEYCEAPTTSLTFNPEVIVISGQTAQLNCSTVGVPAPTITWTRDGKVIDEKYDPRYTVKEDQTLEIKNSQEQDRGVYECIATNNIGSDVKNLITLIVADPNKPEPPTIVWDKFAPNVTVPLAEQAILNCPATGNPTPVILWSKDGQPINDDRNYHVNSDQTLTITSAQMKDSGLWSCTAINNVGNGTQGHIQVTIDNTQAPTQDPLTYKSIMHTVENTLTVIPCGVIGIPTPHITWFKDGQPIKYGFYQKYKLDAQQNMIISGANQDDVAVYRCIADNGLGTVTHDIELFVHQLEHSTPPITNNPVFSSLVEGVMGRTITLNCSVVGNPAPTITWYKNGAKVDNSNSNMAINGDQTLTISNLEENDAGSYDCTAENGINDPLTNRIVLTLIPSENTRPPTIVPEFVRPQVKGILGSELILVCPVTGKPRLKVVWVKDGIAVTSNNPRYFVYTNQTLKIKPLLDGDAGLWACVATNNIGSPVAMHMNVTVEQNTTIQELPNQPHLGDDVIIPCPINSEQIVWLKDNNLVEPHQPNIHINHERKTLTVLNAQLHDMGVYMCADDSPNILNPYVVMTLLKIVQSPTVVQSAFNPDVNAEVHGIVVLNCSVTGIPRPKITWTRRGEPLDNSRQRYTLTKDQSLMILDVLEEDSGNFECVADNGVGQPVVNTVHVVIYEPLSVDPTRYVPNVVATVGDTTVLDCAVVGKPHPATTWAKNNVPVDPYDQHAVTDQQATTLTINGISHEDAGLYRCTADNGVSKEITEIVVTVQDKQVPPSKDPAINPIKRVPEGETVQLVCPVIANPPPTISWVRGEQMVVADDSHILHQDGSLEIKNALKSDEGTYACIANNDIGPPLALKVLLAVEVPEKTQSQYYIVVAPGSKLVINCDVLATPDATWHKNGHPIYNDESAGIHVNADKSLTIEKAKITHEGNYVCVSNKNRTMNTYDISVGEKKQPAHVVIETVPTGGNITLNCNFADQSSGAITWLRGNVIINSDNTKYQINPDNTLTIINARDRDQGRYNCINNVDNVSNEFRVIVGKDESHPPSGTTLIQVPNGTTVTLVCPSNEQSSKPIMWEKDGIPVDNSDPKMSITDDKSLVITNTQEPSGARYTCNNDRETNEFLVVPVAQRPGSSPVNNIFAIISPSGSDTVLNCSIQGDIIWSKGGQSIDSNGDEKHQILPNGALKIKNPEKTDAGKYTCKNKNDDTKEDQFILSVDQTTPPTTQSPLVTITPPPVVLGSSLILDCGVSGPVSGPVTWYKDNAEVDLNSKNYRLGTNQTLEVRQVDVFDAGVYTCTRKNDDGTIDANVMVVTVDKDEYVLPGKAIIKPVPINSAVDLTCGGEPGDIITWYKDNSPIIPERELRTRINQDQTLSIDSMKKADAGSYTCIRQSDHSSTKNMFVLVVYGDNQPESPDHEKPPGATQSPVNHVILPPVSPGSTVTLSCALSGPLTSSVDWYRRNRLLKSDEKYRINLDQTINILNVDVFDSGSYYCKTRNKGVDVIHSFAVKTELNTPYPAGHVIVLPVYIGNMIALQCSAGMPILVTWTKNEKKLEPNNVDTHITDQGILKIDKVKAPHAGIYVCTGDGGYLRNVFIVIVPTISHITSQIVKKTKIPTFIGTTVILKCSLKGENYNGTVIWTKRDTEIKNTDPDLQVLPDQSLQISHIKKADEGSYSCIIFHRGVPMSNIFLLTVSKRETVQPPLISTTVPANLGSDINLKCVIPNMHGSGKITWLKDDKVIDSKGSHIFVKQDQTLQINKIQKTDAGTYLCSVHTKNGPVSSAFIVTVRDSHPPLDPSATVLKPSPLNLPLALVALLPEDKIDIIIWCKDGVIIPDNDGNYKKNGKILNIVNLTPPLLGIYTATGKTPGDKIIETDIIVVPDPLEPWYPGATMAILTDTVVGNTLIMRCNNDNLNNAIWTKDNYVIDSSNPKYRLESDGSLVIPSVEQPDEAVYSCTGEKQDGTRSSNTMSVTVANAKSTPTVAVKPALPGISFTVDCGLPDRLLEDAIWAKDNIVIDYCNKKYKILENKTLLINDFVKSDIGLYKCIANYYDGSRSVDITIVIDESNPSQEVIQIPTNVGKAIKLQCVCLLSGQPSVSVTWTRKNKEISNQNSGIIISADGTLVIRQIAPSDGGEITCTDNKSGKSKIFIIQIPDSTPPTTIISQFKREVSAFVGQKITLSCPVTGNPLPLITWTKNGRPINNIDNRYKLNDDQTLEIKNAHDSDQGIFNCLASNEHGELSNEMSLIIRHDVPQYPRLTVNVQIGMSANVDCTIPNTQGSQLVWSKNDIPLDIYDPRYHFFQNQLQIDNIMNSDIGVYQCHAVDFRGKLESKEIELVEGEILEPPSSDGSNLIGATVNLNCNIDPGPNQVVSWTKDGLPLLIDERVFTHPNMSLTIENLQRSDLGHYVCTGINTFGNLDTREFNLYSAGQDNTQGLIVPVPGGTAGTTMLKSVPIGSTVTIACEITGNPEALVVWRKDLSPLSVYDPTKVHVYPNQTLVIEDFQEPDYGTYFCSGVNAFGIEEKREFIISQSDDQTFLQFSKPTPTLLPLSLGVTVTMNCMISTSDPSYPKQWKKDGIPINLSDSRIEVDASHSKFVINDFQESDYGLYSCSATDIYGQFQEVEYKLVPEDSNQLLGEEEQVEPISINVLLGSRVNMNCPAQADSGVTWLRNNIPITDTSTLHLVDLGHTIMIDAITEADFTEYVCINNDNQRILAKYKLKNACEDGVIVDYPECIKSTDQLNLPKKKVAHKFTKQQMETEYQESYVPVKSGQTRSNLIERKPPKCDQDVSNLHELNMIWPAETCTEFYECEPERTNTYPTIYVPKLKTCPPENNFNPNILKCEPSYKYGCVG